MRRRCGGERVQLFIVPRGVRSLAQGPLVPAPWPTPQDGHLPPGVTPIFEGGRDGGFHFDVRHRVGNAEIDQPEFEKYGLCSP